MADNGVFGKFMEMAGKIETLRINREEFLRKSFKHNTNVEISKILKLGPIGAGVSKKVVSEVADSVIKQETLGSTWKSTLAGIPGGLFMFATIPADIVQFYGHVLIAVQKLMYLYGWEEDIFDEFGNLDDATKNIVIVYVGVMFGVAEAGKVAAKISTRYLTKQGVQYISKKILAHPIITAKMIYKISAVIGGKTVIKSAGKLIKIVPVLGGAVSGAVTYIAFIPMAKRLKKHFESGVIEAVDEDIDL